MIGMPQDNTHIWIYPWWFYFSCFTKNPHLTSCSWWLLQLLKMYFSSLLGMSDLHSMPKINQNNTFMFSFHFSLNISLWIVLGLWMKYVSEKKQLISKPRLFDKSVLTTNTHFCVFPQKWYKKNSQLFFNTFFILILSPSLRKSPTLSLPDLIIYSPDCPQYIAYRISSKNLVLDQLMIPWMKFF